jgi:hypothetical protein
VEPEDPSPAVVITCALVRITPRPETTKPEPWPALPSGLEKYETIVTTPEARRR